jgi:hypothetical protein
MHAEEFKSVLYASTAQHRLWKASAASYGPQSACLQTQRHNNLWLNATTNPSSSGPTEPTGEVAEHHDSGIDRLEHPATMVILPRTRRARSATYVENQAAGQRPTQQRNSVRHMTASRRTSSRKINQRRLTYSSSPGMRASRASRMTTRMTALPSSSRIPSRMRYWKRTRTMSNFTASSSQTRFVPIPTQWLHYSWTGQSITD